MKIKKCFTLILAIPRAALSTGGRAKSKFLSVSKTKQLLISVALVTIGILATSTAFTVRQGEVSKTAHPTAPKDILQFTSGGHVLGFAKDGVYVAAGSHALRVEFVNAHSTSPAGAPTPSAANSDKKATPLSKVTYPNLWDGVTLTYDAPTGAIARSTYRLEPYAKTANIRLRYNAPVSVQGDGSLRISFKTGTIDESAPLAWQERDGKRVPVQVAFAPRGKDEITFTTGQYDRSGPLFIDPTLTWNTFLGGSDNDSGVAVAVDGDGNVYVAGYSSGTWGSPVRAFSSAEDAFVAKLDSSGSLTWNTFLGSSTSDVGFAVAVDGSGNVYVAGNSSATWGSPVRAYTGNYPNAFAAKLDSSGNLTWNTYLAGSANSYANAVAVDGSGNVYVAGDSLATWGSPVLAYTGTYADAFAAKLDSSGTLTWNTFFGGSGYDSGAAVAVDGSGNVYVAGWGQATWGSPVTAFSGGYDAFAAKLDSSGTLTWNTFLGGSGTDYLFFQAVAVDGSGNVYVAGYSDGTWGLPVSPFSGGADDAFAAKLDSNGNLTWNTFLGGSGDDFGHSLAVDGSGNVYVVGESDATWGSPARAFSGGFDAYAAKLDSSGNLTWSTFLGGSDYEYGSALAVDGSGNVYVAGDALATWGSPVRAFSGNYDAFVAKIGEPPPAPSYSAQIQPPINANGTSVFNVNRRVIPVKFTLTQDGIPTCALPPATITVTRTAGGTTGEVNESVYAMSADTGSNFRIASCQYIYSLSASALGLGTYRADIKINGTVVGNAIFQLK